MVNVGGPSKGCLTCIKRKIRCNREQPTCLQCRKANRKCEGYRDATDVMFQDQTQKVIAKAHQGSQNQTTTSVSTDTTSRSQPSDAADASIGMSSSTQFHVATMTRSPKLDEECGLVDFFMNNFTCSDSVEMRSNLFWIPRNFDALLKDTNAKLSIQAAGAMALARLQNSPYYLREAQKKYSVAALRLSEDWRTDMSAGRDTMFITILFLSFFEILACYDASCPKSWRTHLYGLGSLFEQRGEQYLHTEFGARMFRQTRSQVILNALQTKSPVIGVFATLFEHVPNQEEFKKGDNVDRLLIRMCELQSRIGKPQDAGNLLSELTTLHKDLRDWTESTVSSWSYSEQPSKHPTGLWWESRFDIYISDFVAHVWDKVRSAQIITLDMISEVSCLHAAESMHLAPYQENPSGILTPEIRQLVTDICATIPMSYRPSSCPAKSSTESASPRLGATYWWIWPLEVIGSMKSAPPELTCWSIQCLEKIFSMTGIKTAQIGAFRLRARLIRSSDPYVVGINKSFAII